MQFNSLHFLIFYPGVLFVYFLLPRRVRYIWLLAASYYFYMSWNAKYALLLFFSTAVTYAGARLMEGADRIARTPQMCNALKKGSLLLVLISNLGILFFFKYLDFALTNFNVVLNLLHVQALENPFDLLLPVGISFYTFQALGYLIDVYQNKIKAERNFFKYALFVSFFPQLVAGPIERSENLLPQIQTARDFDADNARYGLLTIAWGLFLKIVLADNLAAVIDPVFTTWQDQSGAALLTATVLFAFQIYADFNGYTQIAIGSARALGFTLMENFDAPYLAANIKDFWKRWHISLTMWFQDYLYMPLALADAGPLTRGRWQHIPPWLCQILVFLCSGLWHGAAWHYVVWGGLNGLYLAVFDATKRQRRRACRRLKIDTGSLGWNCLGTLATFVLVDFSLLFFRAENLASACGILQRIGQGVNIGWFFSTAALEPFDSMPLLFTVMLALLVLLAADIAKVKHIDIRQLLLKQQVGIRWVCYAVILLVILYWGAYGNDYTQAQFIYFQF